jgi:hypothetical protein
MYKLLPSLQNLLGLQIGLWRKSQQTGTAMRDQGYGVPALSVLALVVALGCVYASVLAYVKTHPFRDRPQLIKCAAASEGSPCFPDPGMQRLGFPQPLPFDAPPQPRLPPVVPSR